MVLRLRGGHCQVPCGIFDDPKLVAEVRIISTQRPLPAPITFRYVLPSTPFIPCPLSVESPGRQRISAANNAAYVQRHNVNPFR